MTDAMVRRGGISIAHIVLGVIYLLSGNNFEVKKYLKLFGGNHEI